MTSTPSSYHCPNCKNRGINLVFQTLPELRQHVLDVHINKEKTTPQPIFIPSQQTSPPLRSSDISAFKSKEIKTGLSDPEKLAQAKKYILEEAMKSTEEGKTRIKKLSDELKQKEANLGDTTSKLETLAMMNKKTKEEMERVEAECDVMRRRVEELKEEVKEKEKVISQKNKELQDQSSYIKSLEGKEVLAKEKLQKTVQRIIERAERAERELQEMKKRMDGTEKKNEQTKSSVQDNKGEIQKMLASANTASNKAHLSSLDPSLLSTILPNNNNPLLQIYLKNFLEKYHELSSKDFAFNQTLPPQPDQAINQPINSNHQSNTDLQYILSRPIKQPTSPLPRENIPPETRQNVATKRQPVIQEFEPEEAVNTNNNNNNNNNKNNNILYVDNNRNNKYNQDERFPNYDINRRTPVGNYYKDDDYYTYNRPNIYLEGSTDEADDKKKNTNFSIHNNKNSNNNNNNRTNNESIGKRDRRSQHDDVTHSDGNIRKTRDHNNRNDKTYDNNNNRNNKTESKRNNKEKKKGTSRDTRDYFGRDGYDPWKTWHM